MGRPKIRSSVHTCFPARLLGLEATSILFMPTPMAPDETKTTLCPSSRKRTTVSTIDESIDRSGWCVCSWIIEDVPVEVRHFVDIGAEECGEHSQERRLA